MRRSLAAGIPLIILFLALFPAGCAAREALPLAENEASPSPSPTAAPTEAPTKAPTPMPSATPAPVSAKLYVPDAARNRLVCISGTIEEDSPLALLDALVSHGALPDVDYGRNLYFTVGDSFVKVKNKVRKPAVVARLDVGGAFLAALDGMTQHGEELALQSLANTFIDYYGAQTCMVTIEGVKLETDVRDYERGVAFDQYVQTTGE